MTTDVDGGALASKRPRSRRRDNQETRTSRVTPSEVEDCRGAKGRFRKTVRLSSNDDKECASDETGEDDGETDSDVAANKKLSFSRPRSVTPTADERVGTSTSAAASDKIYRPKVQEREGLAEEAWEVDASTAATAGEFESRLSPDPEHRRADYAIPCSAHCHLRRNSAAASGQIEAALAAPIFGRTPALVRP